MKLALSAALVGLAVLTGGCGSGASPQTPSACLSGPGSYLVALRDAPGEVRLDGSVAISSCLVDEQSAGEIADVGSATVAAATRLNSQARSDPAGPAATELGYLVGALEHGADETAGIHQDLLRRIESAARFSPGGEPPTPEFRKGFAQGLAAGRANG
jgi:hypothetical protein